MIRLSGKSGSSTRFEISNDGWKYWEAHQETGVERIEAEVRRLLDPAANVGPYASAFARWKEAEAMLWQDRDGEHWVTEVGHVCREAMQAFAAAFCAEQGQAVTSGPSNTLIESGRASTHCASGCGRPALRSTTRARLLGHGERSRAATGTRSREGGRADRLGRREARRDADSDGDDRVDARERSRAMSDWWIPRSVEDLEAAVERGDVTETYHLDFKQFTHAHDEETKIRVPPRCREVGHGLAVNGGVVVIGVAELHARGCTYAGGR